jgi:hypothetical protein
MAFRPPPVQHPRIPIWVVGAWPAERSMARAARYEGLLPNVVGGGRYTPELVGEMRDWIAARRGSVDGYDIVLEGPVEPGEADEELRRFGEMGATWWIHSDWESGDVERAWRRIEAGPPRL